MKDLVTGATGFIGSHLVRSLVEEGRQVRALVRRGGDSDALRAIGVDVVQGDIIHPDTLPRALEDVGQVLLPPRRIRYFPDAGHVGLSAADTV